MKFGVTGPGFRIYSCHEFLKQITYQLKGNNDVYLTELLCEYNAEEKGSVIDNVGKISKNYSFKREKNVSMIFKYILCLWSIF